MALFDPGYAARGIGRDRLLGIILICGIRKARVQIPLQSGGRQAQLQFHKQNKFQESANTEDEMLGQLTALF
jgi:hypothetical protein